MSRQKVNGPWEISSTYQGMAIIKDPEQRMVAEVFFPDHPNVALIAAAPELLAALKLAEAELTAISKLLDSAEGVDCIKSHWELKQIRSAIAKAEGNE